MFKLRDSAFLNRHRPAIFALLWLVTGISFVMMAVQGKAIPKRDELRQAAGIIDALHEDSSYVRHGPDVYTLRLRLRGSDTEYLINSGRLNGAGPYARARRALQRGSEVALWYEAHPDFGNRLWQIDQQGRRLMHYRETFDHESSEQMNIYLWLLGYLVASIAVVPLLLSWRRRNAENAARKSASIEVNI